MLKDSSYFKKSTGDEAGAATKKGFINSQNTGKVYFAAWSMDVKVEGENVVRHLDTTTHNHGSGANAPAPWPFMSKAAMSNPNHPCVKSGDVKKVQEACPKPAKSKARGGVAGPADNTSAACCSARKCMLVPYRPKSRCSGCKGKTGHHPVPVAELSDPRKKGQTRGDARFPEYSAGKGPAICVTGKDHDSRTASGLLMEHGRVGAEFTKNRNDAIGDAETYEFREGSEAAAQAVADTTGCDKACIKRQLDDAHRGMGINADSECRRSSQKADVAKKKPKAKTRAAG
jgi:hypothetical protein